MNPSFSLKALVAMILVVVSGCRNIHADPYEQALDELHEIEKYGHASWVMKLFGNPQGCEGGPTTTYYRDHDGDGEGRDDPLTTCVDAQTFDAWSTAWELSFSLYALDCNDDDPTILPRAPEWCDGQDNDCDGVVDEPNNVEGPFTVYADTDGDGYGDPESTLMACSEGDVIVSETERYVVNALDCDDASSDVYPGAPEICDGQDNDCDGLRDDDDDDVVVDRLWYADVDGDGHGRNVSVRQCRQPQGYVATADDCDDDDPDRSPSATEVCDGEDNDCDEDVDDDDLDVQGQSTWFADSDGDGWGDASTSLLACDQPEGYIASAGDCDDLNDGIGRLIHPGATEVCNGLDDNCNGLVDDNPVDDFLLFADVDGDSFGDPEDVIPSCVNIDGRVRNALDCDDANGDINPDADEICDGEDNDCDEDVDDDDLDVQGQSAWFADGDGDTFGVEDDVLVSCNQPNDYVAISGDCDDTNGDINPDADEICDRVDNDCDEDVDDDDLDVQGQSTWFADADDDGRGDASQAVLACFQPEDYVANDFDCNDNEPRAWQGRSDVCDGVDNDCIGGIDSDEDFYTTFYPDVDNDQRGADSAAVSTCFNPGGYITTGGDCNDNEPLAWTGADEVCDHVDNDCDGDVDDDDSGVEGRTTWYPDNDLDGYGDPEAALFRCFNPGGYITTGGDCNDDPNAGGALAHTGATEVCDGVDNDCENGEDGAVDATLWYRDRDVDGYGDELDVVSACVRPTGRVRADGADMDGQDDFDCIDTAPGVHPGAPEVCNSIDDDCDTFVDGDDPSVLVYDPDDPSTALGAREWYPDVDFDGWGDEGGAIFSCFEPSDAEHSWAEIGEDCDDDPGDDPVGGPYAEDINPDGDERCDYVDNDCDGEVDEGDVCVTVTCTDAGNAAYVVIRGDLIGNLEDPSHPPEIYNVQLRGGTYLPTPYVGEVEYVFTWLYTKGVFNVALGHTSVGFPYTRIDPDAIRIGAGNQVCEFHPESDRYFTPVDP